MPRRPLILETLEDRILCSASVPVEAAPEAHKADAATASAAVAVTTDAPAPVPAPASSTHATSAPPPTAAAPAADTTQLTDAQRAAIESVVKDSTNTIWFQQNVGQFAELINERGRWVSEITFPGGSLLIKEAGGCLR